MKIKYQLIYFFLLVISTHAFAQKQQKPNVLFIAVDDLKPILGCYGNTQIKTPNIDRLAKMSTVFMRNYCQQAVCGPTRASLMTGMRPDVTKVWDLKTQMRDMNPDILTLPQYMGTQGYTTSGIGKIYHPSSAIKKIDPLSWNGGYLEAEAKDYANGLGKPANTQYQKPETKAIFANIVKPKKEDKPKTELNEDENPTSIKGPSIECIDVPDDAYEDGVIALKAKQQIIKLTQAKTPFFMAVGFHKPHMPFVAPKKYWDLYKRADMPIAPFQEHAKNSPLIAYHRSGELRNYTDIPEFVTLPGEDLRIGLKEEKQKELIHGYYAAISYLDAQVGILLKTLDSLGTTSNTIIVLWGDHGWHLGDHDLWNKHTTFEQATRAPLIIAAPGLKPGKTNAQTEHVDIFPTICNLAGLPIPSQLQGKSLKPIKLNKQSTVKEYSVSQYPRKFKKEEQKKLGYANASLMGYAIRTANYRYVIWMNNFTSTEPFDDKKIYAQELYDYTKDPLEKINVANETNYSTISKSMYNKMVAYFKTQEKK